MLRRHELMAAGAGGYNAGLYTDDAVKAVWRMESGALLVDSKGGNTLSKAASTTEDTVDFKEGSCCATGTGNNALTLGTANQDSGFPTKFGESNKSFSFCFWYKWSEFVSTYVLYKGLSSWYMDLHSYHKKFRFRIYDAEGDSTLIMHDTAIGLNKWYHVGMTFDGNNGPNFAYRIRVWDDEAGAILGVDKVGTITRVLNLADYKFTLGVRGKMDEGIAANRIFTQSEIDDIRDGVF